MVLLYCHHVCRYFLNLSPFNVTAVYTYSVLTLKKLSLQQPFIPALVWGRGIGLWSQFLLLPSQPPALSPSSPAPDFSFLLLFSSRQCDCGVLQASCSCQVMPPSLFPTVEIHWCLLSQLLLWSCLVTPCVCHLPELCNNNHSLTWCLHLLCVHHRGNFNKWIY